MHETKHEILRTRSYETRTLLIESAAAASITVDELVSAGLGRPASLWATRVAEALKAANPRVFVGLHHWPYECAMCRQLVTEVGRCIFCNAFGCATCVTGKGCPPCVERKRKELEAKRREAEAVAS